MSLSTFFSIEIPTGDGPSHTWASRHWDTFGFDYDVGRSKGTHVFAWPLTTAEELAEALREAGITFTTFQADPETLLE